MRDPAKDACHIPPWLRRGIWMAAGLFLFWVFALACRHPFRPGHNTFSAYYYAALAIRTGEGAGALPPDYIYPPFLAWALQPLSRLSIAVAFRVWLGLSFLLTFSSMLVGWRAISRSLGLRLEWKNAVTIVLAAFLLSAGEAKTEWSVAQCDGLVLDSFSFSLALLYSQPLIAGLVIAVGANIKYQTLVLIPYLFWRGHGRAGLAAVVGLPVIGGLSALSLGWRDNLVAWSSALGGLGKFIGLHSEKAAQIHALDWNSSISLPSAWARILPGWGLDARWAFPMAGLFLAVLCLEVARLYRRYGHPLMGPLPDRRLALFEWSAILIGLLAFGPQTTRRHLFILMLVHLLIVVLLFSRRLDERQRRLLFWTLLFYQLGLRLPPSGDWCSSAADAWKWMGGPAWCILPLLIVILRIGVSLARLPLSIGHTQVIGAARVSNLSTTVAAFLIAVMVLFGTTRVAQADTPFFTDDPLFSPHWEFGLFAVAEHNSDGNVITAPILDMNYTVKPNLRINLALAAVSSTPHDGPRAHGFGTTDLKVKWRFIEEDTTGWRPAVSIAPKVTLPTARTSRNLSDGVWRAQLPMEFGKSMGPWYGFAEIGYQWAFADEATDVIFGGAGVLYTFNAHWSAGLEIYSLVPIKEATGRVVATTLGLDYTFNENWTAKLGVSESLRENEAPGPRPAASFYLVWSF